MLIFINPKSEARNPSVICFALHGINPKQYLNTKLQIQNKHIIQSKI